MLFCNRKQNKQTVIKTHIYENKTKVSYVKKFKLPEGKNGRKLATKSIKNLCLYIDIPMLCF